MMRGDDHSTVGAMGLKMSEPRPTIPMTVIAGYLGSGKTTLLNRIIAECDTSRFAILVNDFGKLNIDAELVELEGGQAFRLESGCICCNVGNSLMTTLLQVLRMEPRPERILVEASGVAEPARIADIARLSPSLHPGRVIVLADSARIRAQLSDALVGETVRKQIEAADLLLLNKADLCAPEALTNLSASLSASVGQAPIYTTAQSIVPIAEVLAEPEATPTPNIGGDASTTHADVFWSWSYESAEILERAAFEAALQALAPLLERAKGFVRFDDAPDRTMVVQLSGSTFSISEARRTPSSGPKCRIELIGVGERPDTAALGEALDRAKARPSPQSG